MQTNSNRKSRWYFGGLASAGAACVTHPLDLLKVHLQTGSGVTANVNKDIKANKKVKQGNAVLVIRQTSTASHINIKQCEVEVTKPNLFGHVARVSKSAGLFR